MNDVQKRLAQSIDHTALKPETTNEHIQKLCNEALEYHFATVCVQPHYVHLAHDIVDGSNVKVCSVIGFPHGATFGMVKAHEARTAIARGADEIDMVINIADLKNGRDEDALYDIEEVTEVCHSLGVPVKVIIETCLLTTEEKIRACTIITRSLADYIKTSTGFSTGGATLEDIQLFKQHIGPMVKIKASGGIRTAEFALQLLDAGADRIGASASIDIVNGAA